MLMIKILKKGVLTDLKTFNLVTMQSGNSGNRASLWDDLLPLPNYLFNYLFIYLFFIIIYGSLFVKIN